MIRQCVMYKSSAIISLGINLYIYIYNVCILIELEFQPCDCDKNQRFPYYTVRKASNMGENKPGGIVAAASKFHHAHVHLTFQCRSCDVCKNFIPVIFCVFASQRTGCRW